MARKAPAISCGPEDQQELERLAGSRTESKQMIERARIILGCLAGRGVKEVARTCRTRPNTVIKWRQRFAQRGLAPGRSASRNPAKPRWAKRCRHLITELGRVRQMRATSLTPLPARQLRIIRARSIICLDSVRLPANRSNSCSSSGPQLIAGAFLAMPPTIQYIDRKST